MLYNDVIKRVKNLGEVEGIYLDFFSFIIRIFCIMVLGAVWVYLISHPGEDDE